VQELITGLSANKAIILSTHILDEAVKVCNRAIILSQGKILVDSTPEALSAEAPNHNAIRLKFKAVPGPEIVRTIRELPWCGRVNLVEGNRLEILPEDRKNHLMELLEVVGESELDSIQLLEGRLDDLFREVTEGVCA
jgi:ABC-2 type transport system ATP-binding protein